MPQSSTNMSVKRGKYLTACPSIDRIYNKPLRRKDQILLNGNKCKVVTLDKNPIFVQNTCAFDTIVEVFTTAYCNYSTFKLTVDASNSQIFSFVKKYATEGVSQSLYKKRAEILRSTYPIENGYMNCYGSLTSLLTSLLKNDPCLVTTKNCFKCGIIKEEKPTIDYFEELPDINNFKQNFVEFLTKKIREISEEECHICKSKVTVNKKLSGLLIFDVEDLFQVLISKFPDGVQIADMPDEILVQNNTLQPFAVKQMVCGKNLMISGENLDV